MAARVWRRRNQWNVPYNAPSSPSEAITVMFFPFQAMVRMTNPSGPCGARSRLISFTAGEFLGVPISTTPLSNPVALVRLGCPSMLVKASSTSSRIAAAVGEVPSIITARAACS